MGEAVRKENSMEDILASIRKIISSETSDSNERKLNDPSVETSANIDASDDSTDNVVINSAQAKPQTTSSISNSLENIKAAVAKSPKPSHISSEAPSKVSNPISSPTSSTPLTSAPISKSTPVQAFAPKTDEQGKVSLSAFAKQVKSLDGTNMSVAPASADIAVTPLASGMAKTEQSIAAEAAQKSAEPETTQPISSTMKSTNFLNAKKESEDSLASSFKEFAKSIRTTQTPTVEVRSAPFDDASTDSVGDSVDAADSVKSQTSTELLNTDTQPVENSVIKSEENPVFEPVKAEEMQAREVLSEEGLESEDHASTFGFSSHIEPENSYPESLQSEAKNPVEIDTVEIETVEAEPAETKINETAKFKEALVAPATKAAVASSIDRLKKSVEDVNTAHVESMLRPMLSEWLDNNLPKMVEGIVREEISRITQGISHITQSEDQQNSSS